MTELGQSNISATMLTFNSNDSVAAIIAVDVITC